MASMFAIYGITVRYLWITLATLMLTAPQVLQANNLRSGEYTILQSWPQERDYQRSYIIKVPDHVQGKMPVVLFLHGNGGNAEEALNVFIDRNKSIADRYILVFPDGYQHSWNIVAEASKADDRGFIEAIIMRLASYNNVQAEHFSIIGNSNGAALVNQLAIECQLPNIRNYISGVSPLTECVSA